MLIVRDFMTTPVVTATAGDGLYPLLTKMSQCAIRHIPVVDADEKLVGIISDRDLRLEFPMDPDMTVGQVMTRIPSTVFAEDALAYALELFMEHRYGALPVVDGANSVVGILSVYDALEAVRKRLDVMEKRHPSQALHRRRV